MKIVEVVWHDAYNSANWRAKEDLRIWIDTPVVCTTIGYLVERTRKGITVAASHTDLSSFGGLWFIPSGMIRKVRVIKA